MFKQSLKTILFSMGLFFFLSTISSAQQENALFHDANDPTAGNPNGTVTVVEFFDYQCSHCIAMAPIIKAIIKANPNVRIVFKEFPIRGPISTFAARAALAANMQDKSKYYQFNHELLIASQPLTQTSIFAIAKRVGLNVEKLKKDMNSDAVSEQLKTNFKLAQDLSVSGTPAFFIGKTDAKENKDVEFILGEMSQTELQTSIDQSSK